jgi:hypothetical protein
MQYTLGGKNYGKYLAAYARDVFNNLCGCLYKVFVIRL